MCVQAGGGDRGAGGVQGAGAAADPRGTAGPVRPAIGQGGAGKSTGKARLHNEENVEEGCLFGTRSGGWMRQHDHGEGGIAAGVGSCRMRPAVWACVYRVEVGEGPS
jgi:hypothetical protein